MKRYWLIFGGLLVVALVVMIILPSATAGNTGPKVTIYKSMSCGCCGVYAQYMEGRDFGVEVINTENVASVKNEYGVPYEMNSCHTTVIGEYVVEGHIPVDAIEKLLEESPDIAGIAMPGMPSGSPGMPGAKQGEFVIYAVHHDGSTTEFMRM